MANVLDQGNAGLDYIVEGSAPFSDDNTYKPIFDLGGSTTFNPPLVTDTTGGQERESRKKIFLTTMAVRSIDRMLEAGGIDPNTLTPAQQNALLVMEMTRLRNWRENRTVLDGKNTPPPATVEMYQPVFDNPETGWPEGGFSLDGEGGYTYGDGTIFGGQPIEEVDNGTVGGVFTPDGDTESPISVTAPSLKDLEEFIEEYKNRNNPPPDTQAPTATPAPEAPDVNNPVEEEIDPNDVLDAILEEATSSPDGTVSPTPTAPAGTGQTDRSGNPYDPEMERVYAERNPGYPNPFSLPEEDPNDPVLGGPTGPTTGTPTGGNPPPLPEEGNTGPFGLPQDIWDVIQQGGQDIFGPGGTYDQGNVDRTINRAVRQTQPNPMGLDTPIGNVRWNDGVGSIQNMDPNFAQLGPQGYQMAVNQLNSPAQNRMSSLAMRQSFNAMPEAFQTALDTPAISPNDPNFQALYNQSVGPERDALFASGQYQNQAGQDLIENSDFQGLADERLALLRSQTDPYNQQQQNALDTRLFNRGTLSSKAGSMQQGALDLNFQTRDIQDQLNAQTMADQMRQFNIGAGTNLMGQGDQAFYSGGQLGATGTELAMQGNIAEGNRRRNRLLDVQNQFGFGQQTKANQLTNANTAAGIGNDQQQLLLDMFSTAANPYGYSSNPYSTAATVYGNSGLPGEGSTERSVEDAIRKYGPKAAEIIFGVDLDGDGKVGF